MENLPDDVILHISGFYGTKIKSELSKEINAQKILYSIKECEYYNDADKTWHIGSVLEKILQDSSSSYRKFPWLDWDKIINKAWRSYTSMQREKFIDENFPQCRNKDAMFITGSELIRSKIELN